MGARQVWRGCLELWGGEDVLLETSPSAAQTFRHPGSRLYGADDHAREEQAGLYSLLAYTRLQLSRTPQKPAVLSGGVQCEADLLPLALQGWAGQHGFSHPLFPQLPCRQCRG